MWTCRGGWVKRRERPPGWIAWGKVWALLLPARTGGAGGAGAGAIVTVGAGVAVLAAHQQIKYLFLKTYSDDFKLLRGVLRNHKIHKKGEKISIGFWKALRPYKIEEFEKGIKY